MRRALFLALLTTVIWCVSRTLPRAEDLIVHRTIDVPPGATLTYSVSGVVVQSTELPVGRAHMTIRFEPGTVVDMRGVITDRRGRVVRRTGRIVRIP